REPDRMQEPPTVSAILHLPNFLGLSSVVLRHVSCALYACTGSTSLWSCIVRGTCQSIRRDGKAGVPSLLKSHHLRPWAVKKIRQLNSFKIPYPWALVFLFF